VIFYAIYKNRENCNTIGDILLQGGPRKDLLCCNVVPGRGAAAVPVKFRRGLAGVRPGRVGERSTGHWGPVCGLHGGQGTAGWGVAPAVSGAGRRGWQCRRRGPPAVACGWAASCCRARGGRRGGGPVIAVDDGQNTARPANGDGGEAPSWRNSLGAGGAFRPL
jgi:hypothetical protein